MDVTPGRGAKRGSVREPEDMAPDVRKPERRPGRWLVAALAMVAIVLLGNRMWDGGNATGVPIVAAAGVEQPRVVMYATSWCPYCRKAREFFARHKIAYVEYDVEQDQDARQANRKLGGGVVPTIVVGDDVVRGYSPERLTQLLGPWID